jgi:hypothetical protein
VQHSWAGCIPSAGCVMLKPWENERSATVADTRGICIQLCHPVKPTMHGVMVPFPLVALPIWCGVAAPPLALVLVPLPLIAAAIRVGAAALPASRTHTKPGQGHLHNLLVLLLRSAQRPRHAAADRTSNIETSKTSACMLADAIGRPSETGHAVLAVQCSAAALTAGTCV